ncbi:MAG: type II toxin-antitoxin system VapC family toxin [Zoogloeaceae bacterium]|jgi:predicted nucleic-acid-binding protein|nr:type II toxin-antitoxin system VapC family toxin [Zoogloeaceae bacterium]
MNIIIDTNILVRFLLASEKGTEQHKIAAHFIDEADEIIIPTHVFCELVWVLINGYKINPAVVHAALSDFLRRDKLVIRDDEVEAGMLFLEKGGDFADGVIAHTGRNMTRSRAVFVSFDKKAIRLLTESGITAMLPQI